MRRTVYPLPLPRLSTTRGICKVLDYPIYDVFSIACASAREYGSECKRMGHGWWCKWSIVSANIWHIHNRHYSQLNSIERQMLQVNWPKYREGKSFDGNMSIFQNFVDFNEIAYWQRIQCVLKCRCNRHSPAATRTSGNRETKSRSTQRTLTGLAAQVRAKGK